MRQAQGVAPQPGGQSGDQPGGGNNLLSRWCALPAPVRERLGLASTGWRHLGQAGADCLRAARATPQTAETPALLQTAADIVLWAFGEAPLHGPLAAEILSAPDLPLPGAAREALTAVAGLWRIPEGAEGGLGYFERLAARRDTEKLADFLAAHIAKDPAGLFWREKALALALFAGEAEPELSARLTHAALEHLEAIPGLGPVAAVLHAQAAFLRGDVSACLDALPHNHGCFGEAFGLARTGLPLLAAGRDTDALPHLRRALALAPWQSGLAQATADVLDGARHEISPPTGPTLIMLYTWNKAADLDATLASLFASELYGASVVVLNNGSTDDTAQVLSAWGQRVGETLTRVDLPVNIGAPAARNWLAALPQAQAAESLVYLDDDVDLPTRAEGTAGDWLGRLGAAQRRFPQAGVIGCKVVDHAAPRLLQNVAGHLVIPPEAAEDRPDLDFSSPTPNPFRLCDAHLQGPDWGLFDFIGPCASVTGCCHLFRREALAAPASKGGGFSLALGPSQYDDFERDLRMLDGGGHGACTGHLRVRHRKRSGLSGQISTQGAEAAGANANGNRYKMQTMHTRADIAQHILTQAERLEAHLRARLRHLDSAGDAS